MGEKKNNGIERSLQLKGYFVLFHSGAGIVCGSVGLVCLHHRQKLPFYACTWPVLAYTRGKNQAVLPDLARYGGANIPDMARFPDVKSGFPDVARSGVLGSQNLARSCQIWQHPCMRSYSLYFFVSLFFPLFAPDQGGISPPLPYASPSTPLSPPI